MVILNQNFKKILASKKTAGSEIQYHAFNSGLS
jgi:hypothetical protein